ncbi:MAG: Omp28-related outer membrane protein [Bacteroidales bacterium]|nr:Omp28-related outer membrane protein [Bacteroidales bacterium]
MKKRILLYLTIAAMSLYGCGKAEEGGKTPDPVPDNKDKEEEVVSPDDPVDPEDPAEEEKLEAVDLGLSVAWASINVADGARLAWGETAAKESYSWDNYAWGNPVTKYNEADGKTILDPEDDAAAVLLGSLWRTPTAKEWAELIESPDLEWTWSTKNGTKGYLIKSKKNGNSIFLHATDGDRNGSYWSSSLTEDEKAASSIMFDGSSVYSGIDKYRYAGLAVRAVSGAAFRINSKPADLTPEEQTIQVEIVSSIGYHLSSAPEWITVGDVQEVGLYRYVHSFSVPANTERGSRSGVIVFCNDDNTCVPYSISQDTSFQELLASPEQILFPYKGGADYISITSNVEWTVSCSESWLEVSPLSGSGNSTVEVKAAEYYGTESRTAFINVSSADKSIVRTISVSQDPYDGGEIGVDWSKAFHHSSLIMRFTADWCGYCPMMATALKDAVAQVPGKIVPLNLHGSSSGLAFDKVNTLADQYKIEGYPSGIVDGRRDVPNYNDTKNTTNAMIGYVQETEDNYPVSSAIGVVSTLDGRTLDVNVQLCIRYAAQYKVTAIVTESGIIGWQADYVNGEHSDYHHDDIARKCLTNSVLGDAFEVEEDQRVVTRHYSYNVPDKYKLENLKIVVYVQREYGTQQKIRTADYGDFYVDNAVVAPVGEILTPQYAD